MKRILVTGANGYLGSHISKYLAVAGYVVTAFVHRRFPNDEIWSSLMHEVIEGDIRNEKTITNLTKKHFDIVIHLISLDHHDSEDNPNFVSSINVIPTWNLLDKFTNAGLEKFIYFSTIHVYGKLPNDIIAEEYKPAPLNSYGLTHLLSENICNYFNTKTETSCINVRLSNCYGTPVFEENDCWGLVINDLCRTAIKKKKIKLISDGSPQRDFIHIKDVCRAVEVLVKSTGTNERSNTFHIASGDTLTIIELAYAVKEAYKVKYKKDIPILMPNNTKSMGSNELNKSKRFSIDTSKIRKIGFDPQKDLTAGINELLEYLDCNPSTLEKRHYVQ